MLGEAISIWPSMNPRPPLEPEPERFSRALRVIRIWQGYSDRAGL
jgi:hypothetical protein